MSGHTSLVYLTAALMVTFRPSVHGLLKELQEVCERESFKAECANDEVVIVRRARYGRMKESRCITTVGVIGCSDDVLSYLDDACSGRPGCDVSVASLVPEVQPCASDFRSYLEVAYECVPVAKLAKNQCRQAGLLELRASSGYLSSYVAERTSCGSLDSPWLISVLPGQTIRLTLLDFGVAKRQATMEEMNVRTVYAVINEEAVKLRETLCGGITRQKLVYTSVSSSITVRIVGKEKNGHFLLRYEATGCPNLPAPRHGWVQRMGNKLFYGCNDSFSDRQSLTCVGTAWSGVLKNCSTGSIVGARVSGSWNVFALGHGMSVLIIVCIALSVGTVILMVGLVYLKRTRSRRDAMMAHSGGAEVTYQSAAPMLHEATAKPPPDPADQYQSATSSENDYYRTWQLQRHALPRTAAPPRGIPPSYSDQLGASGRGRYVEHIYESPKFDRRDTRYGDECAPTNTDRMVSSEYFELDVHAINAARDVIFSPNVDLIQT